MSRIVFFICFVAGSTYNYAQNIINVNNQATGVQTQYNTLQAAVTAAQNNDIIYLYPSSTSYGNATINKKLTIIGPGYLVAQNSSLEITSFVNNGVVDNISFAVGSNGTLINGVDINQINLNGQGNIVIKNCKIRLDLNISNSANLLYEGCYFEWNAHGDHKINIDNSTSIIIRNNIFINNNNGQHGWYDIVVSSNSNAIIENNVFNWTIYVFNSIVRNNIFLRNATNTVVNNGTGNLFFNNILVGNQTGLGATNIINVPEANIFEGWPTQGNRSFDNRFMLKAGSPALGAGFAGVDCGAFGGGTPYKLSGIPNIPLVYQINAPTSGSAAGGLNVNVKVRAGN